MSFGYRERKITESLLLDLGVAYFMMNKTMWRVVLGLNQSQPVNESVLTLIRRHAKY